MVPLANLSLHVPYAIGLIATVAVGAAHAQAIRSSTSAERPSDAYVTGFDGTRTPAKLVSVDDRWRLESITMKGRKRWNANEWLNWGSFRDDDRKARVILAAGSILTGDATMLDSDRIAVESQWLSRVELQRTSVCGILWRVPVDARQRDRWCDRLVQPKRKRDELWMASGDQLVGQLSLVGADPSAARDRSTQLRMDPGTGQQALVTSLDNVVAVALASSAQAARPEGEYGLVGLRDGSRLWLHRVVRDESRLQLWLLDGEMIVVDESSFWPEVTGIQLFGPHVTYLSDVATIGFKHIPFLSLERGYGVDRSAGSGWLRAEGHIYAKGLGMHSTSRLAYNVEPSFRRFYAELAIDDAAQGRGSVIFRVYLEMPDNSERLNAWTAAYESPVIRQGDKPLPIAVDLAGARRMALVVDFAERGDEGDHANWLNARLVR
jgi:hypothetical protein